jgi:hypothetical protein
MTHKAENKMIATKKKEKNNRKHKTRESTVNRVENTSCGSERRN